MSKNISLSERKREKNNKQKESKRQSQFQSRHGATLPPVDGSLELQRGAASFNVQLILAGFTHISNIRDS